MRARENTRGADVLRGPLLPRPARPRPVCRHWGRRGVTAGYCREDVARGGEGSGGGAGGAVSERWGFVWAWGMLTFGAVLQHRFLSPLADTWDLKKRGGPSFIFNLFYLLIDLYTFLPSVSYSPAHLSIPHSYPYRSEFIMS
jgi:hypothetical protein